jgi:hypothetical protein
VKKIREISVHQRPKQSASAHHTRKEMTKKNQEQKPLQQER